MKREVNVFLNGASLADVSGKIIAVRVQESPVQDEITYSSAALLPGQKIEFQKRTGLTVSVFAKIRELYDMTARMEAINAINTWAHAGGDLTVSYRPGTSLPVKLIQPASPGNIREYTGEIELVFAADGWPYWQNAQISSAQYAGSNISGYFQIEGNAPATVDAAIYFTAAATYFEVTVDETRIRVTGFEIPSGSYIYIRHNPDGIMDVSLFNTSIYEYLSDDSDDILLAQGSRAHVALTTNGNAEVIFSAKGRWA